MYTCYVFPRFFHAASAARRPRCGRRYMAAAAWQAGRRGAAQLAPSFCSKAAWTACLAGRRSFSGAAGTSDAELWSPSPEQVERAPLTAFARAAAAATGREEEFESYSALHDWSVERPDEFWLQCWGHLELEGTPGGVVVDDVTKMPGANWFPEGTVSFGERSRFCSGLAALAFGHRTGSADVPASQPGRCSASRRTPSPSARVGEPPPSPPAAALPHVLRAFRRGPPQGAPVRVAGDQPCGSDPPGGRGS